MINAQLQFRVGFACFVSAIAVMPASSQARRTITIGDKPSCPQCRIVTVRIAQLGHGDDSIWLLPWASTPALISRNRVAVAPVSREGVIAFYDRSSGRLVGTVGRFGRGPNELGSIQRVEAGAGDTLHVTTGRMHAVVFPDGRVVRKHPAPSLETPLFLPNGGWITNPQFPTRFGMYPAVRLNSADSIVGVIGRPARKGEGNAIATLGRGSRGTMFMAPPYAYIIEQWDTVGRHLLTITRKAAWFPPRTEATLATGRSWDVAKPLPGLCRLWMDSSGLLWVLGRNGAHNWQPGPKRPQLRGEDVALPQSPEDATKYLETIVEVLDPRSGQLVTSARFPGQLIGFAPGLAARWETGPEGIPVMSIIKLQLVRQ